MSAFNGMRDPNPEELTYPKAEIEAIKAEAMPLAIKVDTFVIGCHDDAVALAEYSKDLRRAENKIEERLRPLVDAAHKTHKGLVKLLNDFVEPFKLRQRVADDKVFQWQREQKRLEAARAEEARKKAEEEQKRLEAAERTRVETERLEMAARLEEEGFGEEAQQVIEKSVVVNVPVVTPAPVAAAPKIAGFSSAKRYYADIVDPFLLVGSIADGRQSIGLLFKKSSDGTAWEFNDGALDKMATAQKEEMRIPGVKLRIEEGPRKSAK